MPADAGIHDRATTLGSGSRPRSGLGRNDELNDGTPHQVN
jgi:hypothetical protein